MSPWWRSLALMIQDKILLSLTSLMLPSVAEEMIQLLSKSNLFLSQYISPLLQWDKTLAMQFNDWIDWDWRFWIEVEYSHIAAMITSE
ncbi:hypothetical protein I7I53_05195 [Histoplasma capsulatum var. duboisii H88]|uniref:Uncharacterized protein n=1 Tax=Ajellomyces capsulatus (strain H88) TaxID=544711 RepID=A0A8A1LXH5_AJEC8|nr:hypothetical protein I7I53_05195 [Histoplasma capsulatum var. duboisii H88]